MISTGVNNNYTGSNNLFNASVFKNLFEMDAEQSFDHQQEYVFQTELDLDDVDQTKLKFKHRRIKHVCPDC